MLPNATLKIEYAPINPPKPTGCGVFVGDEMVAIVTLDEFKRTAAKLAQMESAQR